MADKVICVGDERQHSHEGFSERKSHTGEQDGLHWIAHYFSDFPGNLGKPEENEKSLYIRWNFDWNALKSEGVSGFDAEISAVHWYNRHKCPHQHGKWKFSENSGTTFDMKLNIVEEGHEIGDIKSLGFYFKMTPIFVENDNFEDSEEFATSNLTDAVLLVDGKRIPVNKAFLSVHSEYFHHLFSKRSEIPKLSMKTGAVLIVGDQEVQLDKAFLEFDSELLEKLRSSAKLAEDPKGHEYHLQNVTYQDFSLLLKTILPNPEFPTDETAERLLNLANRFEMPGIKALVQRHLLMGSEMRFCKIMRLAEKHGLSELSDKLLDLVKSKEHFKMIKLA